MKKIYSLILTTFILAIVVQAQEITIEINANTGHLPISPYIYGRNNNFSDNPNSPTSSEKIKLYKDAGLRFVRENSGNNSTKYNWRRKLSSHPDWYNNVIDHDWDYEARNILDNFTDVQIMYSFQLLGKVADNKQNNFNDWDYNHSKWWSGVSQNLAGGGVVNPDGGSDAVTEGNSDLYLISWNADSTTSLLNHWFTNEGLAFDKSKFRYWNMDNEPEIWSSTHDDVMPEQIKADEFIANYIDVAIKAREKYPDIKLCGPVAANEWQWFNYTNESFDIDGKHYCWLEYFIKKIAEEEKKLGIKLLDVFVLHWYPQENTAKDVVQLHRVFYDKSYSYPGANGIKTINGGWDSSISKMYIFQRVNDWLNEYFGQKHGIKVGMTEFGFNTTDPNVVATSYASILGTFANNEVELFSPWSWSIGMWEVMHLYSRYFKDIRVDANSSNEELVSAYTSINESKDSITIILVNRDITTSHKVEVNINGGTIPTDSYYAYEISQLPTTETFISHNVNALKNNTINVGENKFTATLPALSTTAIVLKITDISSSILMPRNENNIKVCPNPVSNIVNIIWEESTQNVSISVFDIEGNIYFQADNIHLIQNSYSIDASGFPSGIYMLNIKTANYSCMKKVIVL